MEKIKRTIALRILTIIYVFAYLFFVAIFFIKPFKIHLAWFSVSINLIGSLLVTKSVFYRLDSSMVLGLALYLSSFVGIFSKFYNFQFQTSLYFLAIAIACLVVFFIFRQNIHFILFALNVLEVLILSVGKLYLSKLFFWVVQGGFILIISVLIIISIVKAKENQSAVSNGKKRI